MSFASRMLAASSSSPAEEAPADNQPNLESSPLHSKNSRMPGVREMMVARNCESKSCEISLHSSKHETTETYFSGGCVCAVCRQSRLAAAQLAAQSPLLGWLAACTAGWFSLLATTTATTATTGILMKNVWGNWNPNEKCAGQRES